MNRTLQADIARYKDKTLALQSRNEDLAERNDDDERRLKTQEDEIRRLLASVQSYQEERDQLSSDFDRLKRLMHSSTNTLSATAVGRFESFAKTHPGCDFDPGAGVMTFAADNLFEPGTDKPKPEARAWLQAFADLLKETGVKDSHLLVSGHTDDSPVVRAGFRIGTPKLGHLGLDRATRVRDLLAEARIEPEQVDVAGFEASKPREAGPDDASGARNRRIEIQIMLGPVTRPGSRPSPPTGP